MEKTIDELITEETTHRLEEMGSKDYQFPTKAGLADYLCIGAGICVSLLLIILCMAGVIV